MFYSTTVIPYCSVTGVTVLHTDIQKAEAHIEKTLEENIPKC